MVWTKRSFPSKDRVIVYSLGNFVSNQRRLRTDGGSMVRIELEKKGDSTIVSHAGYYLTWVYAPIENYRKRFFILPCSKFENSPEFFSKPADYQKMKLFIKNSRRLLNNQNVNVGEIVYRGDSLLKE
jgi:poly-gamma-glutamate synthesis protein (capsule biosynthesis protein)